MLRAAPVATEAKVAPVVVEEPEEVAVAEHPLLPADKVGLAVPVASRPTVVPGVTPAMEEPVAQGKVAAFTTPPRVW